MARGSDEISPQLGSQLSCSRAVARTPNAYMSQAKPSAPAAAGLAATTPVPPPKPSVAKPGSKRVLKQQPKTPAPPKGQVQPPRLNRPVLEQGERSPVTGNSCPKTHIRNNYVSDAPIELRKLVGITPRRGPSTSGIVQN